LFETVNIAEYRIAEKPDVVLANLGGFHRTADSILHSADIHPVFDPRNPLTLMADCPAWSVGVFLAFDGFVIRRKGMNLLDEVIVRNERVSSWIRPGNYKGHRSRRRTVRNDAEAYARIIRTGIAQFVSDPRGLRWGRADLRRIAMSQEKGGEQYLNRSDDSGMTLARHGNNPSLLKS
jgi:hypothetical protein